MKIENILNKILLRIAIFLWWISLISFLLILINDFSNGLFYLWFASKDFSAFLFTYSFPIKIFSSVVILLTLLNSIRVSILNNHNSMVNFKWMELNRSEEKILELLFKSIQLNEIKDEYGFNVNRNELLLIDCLKFVNERKIKFQTNDYPSYYIERLTLEFEKYSIILIELHKLKIDNYLLKYSASKYLPEILEIKKYNNKSQLDIAFSRVYFLAHMNVEINYDAIKNLSNRRELSRNYSNNEITLEKSKK